MALVLAAVIVAPIRAFAQQAQPASARFRCVTSRSGPSAFRGAQVYEENDSFGGGDEKYTQGIRLVFDLDAASVPCPVQALSNRLGARLSRGMGASHFLPSWSILIGQNLYTPKSITSRIVDLNDRGFAVYNYVGAALTLVSDTDQSRHSFEVTGGTLGPPDLARGAQGGLHVLKLHRIPKGWDSMTATKLAGYGRYEYDRRVFCSIETVNCTFDLTFGGSLDAGNVRQAGALSSSIRIGYHLRGFASKPIGVTKVEIERSLRGFAGSAAPWWSEFWITSVAQAEGRYVLSSNLVQPATSSQEFRLVHAIGDSRYGFEGGIGGFRADVLWVTRDAEFEIPQVPTQTQHFKSISVGYDGPIQTSVATPAVWRWFLAGWQVDLGMGGVAGRSRVELLPASGLAGHLALRKEFARGIAFGYDYNASTVEGAPTAGEPGNRADIILAEQTVTAAWSRRFDIGAVGVRAGVDVASRARVETITHPVEGIQVQEQRMDQEFPTHRGGWLLGAQYLLPLAQALTIGVDTTYHHVALGGAIPGLKHPDYFAWTIGFQIRTPSLRDILGRHPNRP